MKSFSTCIVHCSGDNKFRQWIIMPTGNALTELKNTDSKVHGTNIGTPCQSHWTPSWSNEVCYVVSSNLLFKTYKHIVKDISCNLRNGIQVHPLLSQTLSLSITSGHNMYRVILFFIYKAACCIECRYIWYPVTTEAEKAMLLCVIQNIYHTKRRHYQTVKPSMFITLQYIHIKSTTFGVFTYW